MSGSAESDEAQANAQWGKFLERFRTDDDEDILWDMFRVIMPAEDQAEMASWFYSYREYFKFGLTYLVLRPFAKYKDETIAELEFGNRMNELPFRSCEIYYDIFDGQIDELRWLYLALCEEVEYCKKTMKDKPKETKFEQQSEELHRMTDNQLLKEILTKSNKKCNALIDRQNTLIEDLNMTVKSLDGANARNARELKESVSRVVVEIKSLQTETRSLNNRVATETNQAIKERQLLWKMSCVKPYKRSLPKYLRKSRKSLTRARNFWSPRAKN